MRPRPGRFTAHFYPSVPVQPRGELRSDVVVTTRFITDVIEQAIREHLDQWCWCHRKRKNHHPELYPEFCARQRRRKQRPTPADA